MNLQGNIFRIREMMGISDGSDDVIRLNVIDENLIKILKGIEKNKNVKFTQTHFDNEKQLSGNVKKDNKGLNQSAIEAFKLLQKNCPNLVYDEDSYRTYERQAELFSEYIDKFGSIEGAMKLRSIPGFSQHHTGKAFDIEPDELRPCVAKNASKFGFIFPYNKDGIRKKEPWHIYYNL